jgi:hypothetical protein
MTTRAYKATDVFTEDDVLAVLADNQAVFGYELFIEAAGLPSKPREIPPEHWQAALKYRTLTPHEQAARERYFERRTNESIRRVTAGK